VVAVVAAVVGMAAAEIAGKPFRVYWRSTEFMRCPVSSWQLTGHLRVGGHD